MRRDKQLHWKILHNSSRHLKKHDVRYFVLLTLASLKQLFSFMREGYTFFPFDVSAVKEAHMALFSHSQAKKPLSR